MSKNQTIQYAVNTEDGTVISRVGSEIALPVLQYGKMQPKNNFNTEYELEKIDVIHLSRCWNEYKWTRKIPLNVKNMHRKFWGMSELKSRPK